MIYLKNISEPQRVLVPKNFADNPGDTFTFRLISTMGGRSFVAEVTELGTLPNYYTFDVALEGLAEGEYIYDVTGEVRNTAVGMARVEEAHAYMIEQENVIIYEQYN